MVGVDDYGVFIAYRSVWRSLWSEIGILRLMGACSDFYLILIFFSALWGSSLTASLALFRPVSPVIKEDWIDFRVISRSRLAFSKSYFSWFTFGSRLWTTFYSFLIAFKNLLARWARVSSVWRSLSSDVYKFLNSREVYDCICNCYPKSCFWFSRWVSKSYFCLRSVL